MCYMGDAFFGNLLLRREYRARSGERPGVRRFLGQQLLKNQEIQLE